MTCSAAKRWQLSGTAELLGWSVKLCRIEGQAGGRDDCAGHRNKLACQASLLSGSRSRFIAHPCPLSPPGADA